MHATLAIFRHLMNVAPPLIPENLLETMKRALDHFEMHAEATIEELERVMSAYGYELWPYNQAFKEELLEAEKKVGEQFLLPKLPNTLKIAYQAYKKTGGTMSALHSGAAAHLFAPAERVTLCEILVELQRDIRAYALQHVVGAGKKHYLSRVGHFRRRLSSMQRQIEHLRILADHEDEHPSLAEEIRAQVRSFEQGLCLLGPELSYDAVCGSVDYFTGRKAQFKHFKHLYAPKKTAFFR